MDLREPSAIEKLLDTVDPAQVIHLAAIAKPAEVESRHAEAIDVNLRATRAIAAWCAKRGRRITFASTDHVFGQAAGPHRESDQAFPSTLYGHMKLDGERMALDAGGLVARLGWVLDDSGDARSDYVSRALNHLRAGVSVSAVDDEWRTPIQTTDLGRILYRLVADERSGTIHVAGGEHTTPYRVLSAKARQHGLDARMIQRASRTSLQPPGRPGDLRLDTTLLSTLLRRDQTIVA